LIFFEKSNLADILTKNRLKKQVFSDQCGFLEYFLPNEKK